MLLAVEAIGSSIERGTLPSAAWCSTSSASLHASRQALALVLTP